MSFRRIASLATATTLLGAGRRIEQSRITPLHQHATRSPVSSLTGMPSGPYPIGVTTKQFDDYKRKDPDTGGPRRLQTEIWYPASDETLGLDPNKYSEFLGRGAIPGSIEAAEAPDAIGGYLPGLTIKNLDATWQNVAVRDARPREIHDARWPLVVFSHGSGAFRASYGYFTEFLASHGFVVMACDHLGSARYTQVDGEVIKPGGARSERRQMEADRPEDMIFLLDEMERMSAGADSRFAGRVDVSRTAVTGMSFGGWASAAALEKQDPRIKAAILKCPSLKSGGGQLPENRLDRKTPVMVMLGSEDTVIGEEGNELGRRYYATHEGPSYLLEILAGGHVSFTSCELYNPNYGNGIGESKSLSSPGQTYTPLPPEEQHEIVNSYALAFLDVFLRNAEDHTSESKRYLQSNSFGEKVKYSSKL